MNWIESPETKDRYWSLKDTDSKFSIIRLTNSFELSYDLQYADVQIRTTHRSWSLEALKLFAETIEARGHVVVSRSHVLLTM